VNGWQLRNGLTEQKSGCRSPPSCSSMCSGHGEEWRGLRHGVAEGEEGVNELEAVRLKR